MDHDVASCFISPQTPSLNMVPSRNYAINPLMHFSRIHTHRRITQCHGILVLYKILPDSFYIFFQISIFPYSFYFVFKFLILGS